MVSAAHKLFLGFVAGCCALAFAGCEGARDTPASPPSETRVVGPGHVSGERTLMGTRFAIQVASDDEAAAAKSIVAALDEVARVEAAISCWRESSETSAVNRAAGSEPVAIGADLLAVLKRAQEMSLATGGAFDITFAACGGLWDYDAGVVPDDAALAACLGNVGFGGLEVDATRSTARLARAGMRIGLGGIGKGYGVDRAAELLESRGFADYIVDGGGDVRLSGTRNGEPWRVGIAHPRHRGALYGKVTLERGAVVTSGDYERFFDRDGVRYHHILDPRTARPARGAIAVTVLAPNAMEADALATGFFVLGPAEALRVAATLPGVEAMVIDGAKQVTRTPGFPELTVLEAL